MLTLRINGQNHGVDAPYHMPLFWGLRDMVGLAGTRAGCGIAQCACTVHLDGNAVRSCLLPVGTIGDRAIATIEAMGNTLLVRQFRKLGSTSKSHNAAIAGRVKIISAAAPVASNQSPRDLDINAAMAGNMVVAGLCPHSPGYKRRGNES